MTASPIDLQALLSEGGAKTIGLLQYCLRTTTMEPVFVFLAREYQMRPNHASALALYDMFCAPGAPARLPAEHLLPPLDLRMVMEMQMLRRQWEQLQLPEPPDEKTALRISQPSRAQFDHVIDALPLVADGGFAAVARHYDPQRPVNDSLPKGDMNAAQRHFVTYVWLPVVRPRLVAAGFWQMATLD